MRAVKASREAKSQSNNDNGDDFANHFGGSSRTRGKTGGDASHSYQHSLVASQAQSLSDDQLRAILQALMVPT
eukprot:gene7189-5176_t